MKETTEQLLARAVDAILHNYLNYYEQKSQFD